MRKLERDLLDLADRWEDAADGCWEEIKKPQGPLPKCCCKHGEEEAKRREGHIYMAGATSRVLRLNAQELRKLIAAEPVESIRGRLATYASKDA